MSNRLPVDILREARARIADLEHWTKDVYARNAKGGQVKSTSPKAVRWCAHGTVVACVLPWIVASPVLDVLNLVADDLYDTTLVFVNDVLGHEAVLTVFDAAIRRAS